MYNTEHRVLDCTYPPPSHSSPSPSIFHSSVAAHSHPPHSSLSSLFSHSSPSSLSLSLPLTPSSLSFSLLPLTLFFFPHVTLPSPSPLSPSLSLSPLNPNRTCSSLPPCSSPCCRDTKGSQYPVIGTQRWLRYELPSPKHG